MSRAPCKDCVRRHLGCHSECEDYRKMKEEREEMRKKIRTDNDFKGVLYKR